jgi:hypothetical protein
MVAVLKPLCGDNIFLSLKSDVDMADKSSLDATISISEWLEDTNDAVEALMKRHMNMMK